MNTKIKDTAVFLIDVQEKLFAHIHDCEALKQRLIKALKIFQLLGLRTFVSEQYPQGLGATLSPLMQVMKLDQPPMDKTTFSALKDPNIKQTIMNLPFRHWLVFGIEAHVCVLQSAIDLQKLNKTPIVISDLVGSRKLSDQQSALNELAHNHIRITSFESITFELLEDAKHPQFKSISKMLR